jgi:hypothetical protein
MANFAKINESNIVLNILKVDDKELLDQNGFKQEYLGQIFLEKITGWPASQWIFENGIRKNPMGIGSEWDSINNIFWPPKPFPSWTKDITKAKWVSPLGDYPQLTEQQIDENKRYLWNEEIQNFELI